MRLRLKDIPHLRQAEDEAARSFRSADALEIR